MITVQTTLHAINLVLFTAALVAHAVVLPQVWTCRRPDSMKQAGTALCIIAILLCMVFLGLRLEWIHSSRFGGASLVLGWAWLIFDYLLAIYLLILAFTIRLYCRWLGRLRNTRCFRCPGRRWTDA